MFRTRVRNLLAVTAVASLAVLGVTAGTASAGTQPVPKVTGSIELANPMQYASFNAFASTPVKGSITYTNFDYKVAGTGVWLLNTPVTLTATLPPNDYHFTLNVDTVKPTSPTASTFTGHGLYVEGNWPLTLSGSISGSKISFSFAYTTALPGYVFSATGTIAADGSLAGTATDTNGQTPLTWTLGAGSASEVFSYTAPVTNVDVTTPTAATFDFTVPAGIPYAGTPIHVAVTDGGSPGTRDTWQANGSFYPIVSGNLVVHS